MELHQRIVMSESTNPRMKRVKRNTSPSPLLLSPRDMEAVILKERMRCDRHSQFFALIVIQLSPINGMSQAKQMRLVAKTLHHKLRMTDEKGLLPKGGLGVMLPMTHVFGARKVQQTIMDACELIGIQGDASIFTYGSSEAFERDVKNDNRDLHDSDSDFDLECRTRLSIHAASHVIMTPHARAIRADGDSQLRSGDSGVLNHHSTVSTTHFCPQYPKWKRATDVVGSLLGLLLAGPVILTAAIAIKATSKGPVFFRQMRTGQFGNPFVMYKLRTMVVDAEELRAKLHALNERDGPAFKIKNDPRVTLVGKFLRSTGIDELPQLWNILIGNMAIVGPRPLPCDEDAQCKTWQRRRLDTKPGLTCFWQISKSRDISFEDWMRMDLQYSRKRSVRSDVSLVLKTVMAVFLGRVGH